MKKLLDNYLQFVKKIIPEREGGNFVGLDIGARSCKMIELAKSGNSFELVSWAIEPIENASLADTLKNVLSKAKAPTKSPVTAVCGKGTLVRYVHAPKMSIDDLRKSLTIEADKYFPFAQEEIYTDAYILVPDDQEKQMLALVTAAKKEIIAARIKLLTDIGLQADFIGLNSIAISNALNVLGADEGGGESSEGSMSALAILDMGESVSSLTISIGNLPRFNRDIYTGGQDITKRISNALEIDIDEAEKIKCNPKENLASVISAGEASLMNLISEMRLSFDYFTTEHNFQITRLLLTGGGAQLDGIADSFSKNLEIPTAVWDPYTKIKIPEDIKIDEFRKEADSLTVALGLALYEFS